MTLKEVRAMTPKEKREWLAERQGYNRHGDLSERWVDPKGEWSIHESKLPDYCNDLNATNNIEVALTYEQHQKFRNELADIVGWNPDNPKRDHHRNYVSASADQRTDALILALSRSE